MDKLPELHRDPFDRIIVVQAIIHDFTIVTSDRLIKMYPVPARLCGDVCRHVPALDLMGG